MANIFQETITPDKPKVLDGERVYVYVPRATLDTPGIASYDKDDFVLNNGKVHLAKDIDEEIAKHNIDPDAHKNLFDTKVDKIAVYRDNKWVGRVHNDGLAVALSTSFHPNGSETLGVTSSATVAVQTEHAWLHAYNDENDSRAYLEPDHFRIETKTPGEANYITLLKIDKNSIQFKDEKLATQVDVNKKVDIETVRDVGYNLMPGGRFNGIVTNTFNTEGIMSIESKAEGTNNDTIRLVFDATRSKLTYNKTSDITYNGEVATQPYVDNKSVADRLYVDTKITEVKKAVPYAFDTFMNFIDWLAGTYVREDGAVPSDLNIGDDVLIVEDGVPDYWVKSKSDPMTIDNFAPYESGDYKPTITWLEA